MIAGVSQGLYYSWQHQKQTSKQLLPGYIYSCIQFIIYMFGTLEMIIFNMLYDNCFGVCLPNGLYVQLKETFGLVIQNYLRL